MIFVRSYEIRLRKDHCGVAAMRKNTTVDCVRLLTGLAIIQRRLRCRLF